MAKFLQLVLQDAKNCINYFLGGFPKWPPGMTPCLAVDYGMSADLNPYRSSVEGSNSGSLDIDDGFLWGVPVSKTPLQRKRTRKYSHHRLYKPAENLVACSHCGSWHEIHTICGECYSKIRDETELIKKKMLNYDPYKGELPVNETLVLYNNDADPRSDSESTKSEFYNGKRIIEMDKPRPSWFSADLKKRWKNATPFKTEKSSE